MGPRSRRNTESIAEVGAAHSIATVGDSFDSALGESLMGIVKNERRRDLVALADNGGLWRSRRARDRHGLFASWFHEERLHGEFGDRTPLEVEADYRDESQNRAA